jgi:hypothetical protein
MYIPLQPLCLCFYAVFCYVTAVWKRYRSNEHRRLIAGAVFYTVCVISKERRSSFPSTCQLDQGFPWFSLVPERIPEGLAGTAWEPSKLPNYVSITPPPNGSVSHYPPNFSLSLSLPQYFFQLPRGITGSSCSWGIYKYWNLALQVGGVSDETVKYGYGFCATRTIEWLHCELQTRPLLREGAPQKQDHNFQTQTFRQEVTSCHKSQSGLDTKTYWLTVSRKVTSTSTVLVFKTRFNLLHFLLYHFYL